MIAFIVRVVLLVSHVHSVWPSVPLDRVLAASVEAVRCETRDIRAELLLAITQHESDFEPSAVSWIENGKRVDRIRGAVPRDRKLVCGYLQAMQPHDRCLEEIDRDGVMRAGVEELREWATTCHGDVACIVRGHAGGTQCAVTGVCSSKARAFSALFIENARRLTR